MATQAAPAQESADASRKEESGAANLTDGNDSGVLILDEQGRICAYELAAVTLFGNTEGQLLGRRISELVVGILVDGDSPDDDAKRLRRLCAANEWRQYEGLDWYGRPIAVTIHLSNMVVDDREVFVLDFQGKAQ